MKRFISNILILFGIACYVLVVYSVYERVNPRRVSFALNKDFKTSSSIKVDNKPIQIQIESINVTLPIIPAKIESGKWEATTEGVSYLSSSPIPGNIGNSILYGHNWPNLLGNLSSVRPGDKIEIVYENNLQKTFEVEYTVTVDPSETHILLPSNDKRITVYTCTGFMDSKRFVVVGILKEEKKELVIK